MPYLMILLMAGLVFGMMGSYVADTKGRPSGEGFIFGFMLGPIGILIVVLLPSVAKPTSRAVATHPEATPEPVAPEDPVQRPRPLRHSPGDDAAMDFTLELIRRGQQSTSLRAPENN